MMHSLLDKYQMGMITDEHLVVETLHMLDPHNPDLVLGSLPRDILLRMLRFAKDFQAGRMVTNYGALPALDQVVAARNWLEKALQQKAGTTP